MEETGQLVAYAFCYAYFQCGCGRARQEFEAALAGEVFFESADDEALIKYMDVAFSFGQEAYSDYRGNALSQLLFGNDPANNPKLPVLYLVQPTLFYQ